MSKKREIENEENLSKMNINWARRNLAKPTSNLHKMEVFAIRLFAYFDKK